MDGIKVGDEDMGDGMTCSDHPYRNNPGGICAFCLQEKLGKLVSSSSFPHSVRASASSSSDSPPPFRSDIATSSNVNNIGGAGTSSSASSLALSLSVRPNQGNRDYCHYGECYTRRTRIPFLMAKKKKKMANTTSSSSNADIVFMRSKSTATFRRRGGNFLDADEEFCSRKRGGFWSFLSLSSKSSTSKKIDKSSRNSRNNATTAADGSLKAKEKCFEASSSSLSKKSVIFEDEDDSPSSQATASASSFGRKVSRSRSVGCGSRSFSGDFFERISTGFGDCTLRRVESQREGKAKVTASAMHRSDNNHNHSHHCMKERVKCGGIFGGFIMTSSSSSSSSSSYLVSSSGEYMNGKSAAGGLAHGRSRSWGWAFASPMRAFSKPSSKKQVTNNSNKKTTPNLDSIPSLLAVRS